MKEIAKTIVKLVFLFLPTDQLAQGVLLDNTVSLMASRFVKMTAVQDLLLVLSNDREYMYLMFDQIIGSTSNTFLTHPDFFSSIILVVLLVNQDNFRTKTTRHLAKYVLTSHTCHLVTVLCVVEFLKSSPFPEGPTPLATKS